MTPTEKALLAIEQERELVREQRIATEASDDLLSVPEWASLIVRHLGLALPHTATEPADLGRLHRQMTRVAWLAVACLESIERKRERAAVAGPTDEQRAAWKGW